ncbi:MAG: hypothetical protein ABFS56_06010 [Pseudomonadota bacterium]
MLTLGFYQELNLYRYYGTRPQEQKVKRYFQTTSDDITDVLASEAPVYHLSESERRVMNKTLLDSVTIIHEGEFVE